MHLCVIMKKDPTTLGDLTDNSQLWEELTSTKPTKVDTSTSQHCSQIQGFLASAFLPLHSTLPQLPLKKPDGLGFCARLRL